MSPKKAVNEEDARERILKAAAEVFAEIGFGGARVDEIAARAGINKAMLYYHVGDKEQLYATVLLDTIDRAIARLTAATGKAESPAEKLQCILDTFAELGTTNPYLVPMMLREVASGGAALPDAMLLRMAQVFRTVADVLSEGMRQGEFRATDPLLTHVSLIGSMMFLIASQPIRTRLATIAGVPSQHTFGDLARHTGNLFLHGLEAEKPAAKRVAASKSKRGKR